MRSVGSKCELLLDKYNMGSVKIDDRILIFWQPEHASFSAICPVLARLVSSVRRVIAALASLPVYGLKCDLNSTKRKTEHF